MTRTYVPTMFAVLAMALFSAPVFAVITVTPLSSATSDTAFDGAIANNDLVNTGQPTLLSVTTQVAPQFGFGGLNNGAGGTNITDSAFYTSSQQPSIVAFTLNTSVNTNGYDIQSIRSFAGWMNANDIQANQKYEVLVSQIGGMGLTSLGTYTYTPFSTGTTANYSSSLELTDTTGVIASNVDAVLLRLIYPGFNGNNSNPGNVYREIDIEGAPSAALPDEPFNLIRNGSFELPVLPNGGAATYTTATPFDNHWVINGETTLVRGAFGTVAAEGDQWLSLESNGGAPFPNNVATISQTIATVPGRQYDLDFDYNALGSNQSQVTQWELTYDIGQGPNVLMIPDPAQFTLNAPWLHESLRFIATSTSTTISFTGQTQQDGFFGTAIDNVSVVWHPVPEPASLSLLAVGGLGLLRRRRVMRN